MGWERLMRLLDSSKGRKPTLILRTQLSVRVNAILGEYMRDQCPGVPPYPLHIAQVARFLFWPVVDWTE